MRLQSNQLQHPFNISIMSQPKNYICKALHQTADINLTDTRNSSDFIDTVRSSLTFESYIKMVK